MVVHNEESHIVQRIQEGDKEAFSDIYLTYYPDLCVFVERLIKSPPICENLVQDLFFKIWLQRTTWNPKGTVRSYLYKAARNRAYDYLKHQKFERSYLERYKMQQEIEWESRKSETFYPNSHSEPEANRELIEDVQKAIDKLPDRMKLIFTLSREEGLSYPEIADILSISVKTVETQMGRALRSLRALLSDYFQNQVT